MRRDDRRLGLIIIAVILIAPAIWFVLLFVVGYVINWLT
jgi:hypothetical protein